MWDSKCSKSNKGRHGTRQDGKAKGTCEILAHYGIPP